MRQVALIVFFVRALCTSLSASVPPNFIAQRVLTDGQVEKRIFRDGTFALETSVPGPGLSVWQVTDGRQFIQTILDSRGEIVDCELSSDKSEMENFVSEFEGVVTRGLVLAKDGSTFERGVNRTIRLTGRTDVGEFILDMKTLGAECERKHRAMKERRTKRDVFMHPGTNWCGPGATTDRYNQLGYNGAADRCCRQHDHCSHIIPALSTKYHMFNYRLHSISHCQCDERFRTCLKMVNSAASNMVGKVFFNVVQMRCFVLKAERGCARRSWWGKCEKYEMQKTAYLRDALSF